MQARCLDSADSCRPRRRQALAEIIETEMAAAVATFNRRPLRLPQVH
jgi:hypothetical protein